MASITPESQADEPQPYVGDRIALYLLVGGFFILGSFILLDTAMRLLR